MINEKKVSQALATAMSSMAFEDQADEALYEDLCLIKAFNNTNNDLINFLKNPWINKVQKIDDVMQLKNVFNYDKTVNLLAIMIKANVSYMLNKILSFLLKLLEERLGIVELKIYSTFVLSDLQIKQIEDAIKNNKDLLPNNFKEFKTTNEIDLSLIGGIKVVINSKVIDNSLIQKLRSTKEANKIYQNTKAKE
ncbi:MAG: ATP synthase F1 subunit delta [Mycoplasmataceae bacterium]|nr:ATP synthase F1 subunit delta [Mycoplasmataceae bacterium]